MRRATSRAEVPRHDNGSALDMSGVDASPSASGDENRAQTMTNASSMGFHSRRTSSVSSFSSTLGDRPSTFVRRPSSFLFACALACFVLASVTHRPRSAFCEKAPAHVIFVDAGSTGCRAHAFAIENGENDRELFKIKTLGTKAKTRLPLAEMGGKVREELIPALRAAAANIKDPWEREHAAVYVWATAGFRILTPAKQQALWREVREAVTSETKLQHGHGHFRTVDGAEEGFYAWLAANYLSSVDVTAVGRLRGASTPSAPALAEMESDNPLSKTVGAIDVGGGSVQFVALPNGGVGSSLRSMIDLRDAVKVESFLGYGANHMETRWRRELARAGKKENACSFPGYEVDVDGATLTGTGSYDACVRGLRKQIAAMQREQRVTLRMPQDFAKIDRFLGMSLLFHLTNFLTVALPGSLPSMPKASLEEIAAGGKKLCATDWTSLVKNVDGKDPNTPTDRLNGRCFDAALVQALLGVDFDDDLQSGEVGLGFTQSDKRIDFIERVDGAEVEWTLGAAMSVVHPTAARANPNWAKTRVPAACARVFHSSFLEELYQWAVIIMPAAVIVTGYLVYKALQAATNVGTMARSPSFFEVL